MKEFIVDLTNCDLEPIHIPGKIQSHGFLMVADHSNIIQFFSENVKNFLLNAPSNLIGLPVSEIENYIDNNPQKNFIAQLLMLAKTTGNEQINPISLIINKQKFFLIISSSADFYLMEFEPANSSDDIDVQKMIGKSVSEMLADKNLESLLNNTTVQVKNIIGYDRVMIYRFADDGHGEVVAEAKNENLESWIGLHYPASDIPKQARELYKLNLTRLINNVENIPANIFTSPQQQSPLDLTWSQLRAVSPIHIQYLKNMGVSSSFSISLMYKGELWGLVACHSYTPRFIDYKSRESAKLIGQILSSALEFRQDEENKFIQDKFKIKLDHVVKNLQHNESIEDALTKEHVNMLQLTNASGSVLVYEKQISTLGIIPEEKQLEKLISFINNNITDPLFTTTSLSKIFPEAEAYKNIGSGMMVLTLSADLGEYAIWFKPEQLQTLKWAGNPDKPVIINESGLSQISPRHSFETWIQDVEGESETWKAEELYAVKRLKEEIDFAINQKAGALRILNEKLRTAYDELDTFSYTISHDLKNPIAAIKTYSQLLGRSQNLNEVEKSMLAKINNQSDKMNFMINEILEHSRISRQKIEFKNIDAAKLINEIVNDTSLIFTNKKLAINIGNTPDIFGEPLMVSQVFSNLINNAVKYSQGAEQPEVFIEGTENENEVCYTIKDNGLGIAEKDLPEIFVLFNRMKNVSHIEGSGVGLAIVKRIVDKHQGKIWAESDIGKGTIFYVSFNKKHLSTH